MYILFFCLFLPWFVLYINFRTTVIFGKFILSKLRSQPSIWLSFTYCLLGPPCLPLPASLPSGHAFLPPTCLSSHCSCILNTSGVCFFQRFYVLYCSPVPTSYVTCGAICHYKMAKCHLL